MTTIADLVAEHGARISSVSYADFLNPTKSCKPQTASPLTEFEMGSEPVRNDIRELEALLVEAAEVLADYDPARAQAMRVKIAVALGEEARE